MHSFGVSRRQRVLLFSFLTMARLVRSFAWLHPISTTTSRRLGRISPAVKHCSKAFLVSTTRLFSTNSVDKNSDKKRIVFLGTPEVAASTLQRIFDASQQPESTFEVVSVVTQPAKRRRRKGSKDEPSPVGKLAEDLGLPVLTPENAKDPDFLDAFAQDVCPDLCITAAYGQYLPKRFLATPALGTVNIHPSLLPKWRGASPVQRSLQAGENPVGVTVLYTVSKMDAGPIIAQASQDIDENDTAATVLPLLFDLGTQLLLQNLPDILDGKISMETVTPQDESMATQATLIHSSEAELKVWEESAITCHNRLRGFSMWPQTYMWFLVGERPDPIKVKVTQTRVVEGTTAEPTTEVILGPTKKDGLYVVCGDGTTLELLQVQPATRKEFPARDFQNGYPGETIRWIQTPGDNA
jgi:methionyl-tRNA formyltransferase